MKSNTSFIQTSRIKVMLLLLSVFSVFAVSCSNDDDDDINTDLTASVTVVNAVEGSAPQDLYLDDSKVTSSAVAYANASAYLTVLAGNRKADFKSNGSASVNSSSQVSLQAGRQYSIYYSGTTTASSNVLVEDDLSTVAGKAKVRFVHLAAGATGAVDAGLSATNKLATNLAYKAASAYYTVDAGTNLQLYAAGSSTVLLNLPTLGLQAGKVYTILISGSTTATVKYTVIVNK